MPLLSKEEKMVATFFQTALEEVRTAVSEKRKKEKKARKQELHSLIERIKQNILHKLTLMKERGIESISIAEFGRHGNPFYLPLDNEQDLMEVSGVNQISSYDLINCDNESIKSWLASAKNVVKRDCLVRRHEFRYFITDIPADLIIRAQVLEFFHWLREQGLHPRIDAICDYVYLLDKYGIIIDKVIINIGIEGN